MSTTKFSSSYHQKALLLIAAAFLFRVLYALFYPVHLVGDEAYYWAWGQRPALGYYSKPAFIAWIYAMVEWIGGNLFSIRFTAVLFGTLSLVMTYLLTRKLFDAKTGFFAVILALAIPGNCLLNFVLTIDAPLVLAWSISLYFLWKYANGERPFFSLAMLFISLMIGHLSKPMMLFFPPLAIGFLASGAITRRLLKKPGTWLAVVGSLVGWLPLLYWNSKNNWITFNHMGSHLGAQAEPTFWENIVERVETFGEFFLSQLGAVSPIIAVLIFTLTVLPVFKVQSLPTNLRFLIIFCGVPLLLILVVACFQKVQPNWPAVLYLAGIPMVAAWFTRAIDNKGPNWKWVFFPFGVPLLAFIFEIENDWHAWTDKTRRRLFVFAISLGFALCGFFYFGPIIFEKTGNEGHTANPNRRLIGSERLGKAVDEIRRTVPDWENHFIVASGHRYEASWLGFELPDHPPVYRLAGSRIDSQFEVWPDAWDDGQRGKDAFFITPNKTNSAGTQVENAFEKVEFIKNFPVKFGSGEITYSIFRCQKLKAALRPEMEKP